MQAAVPRCRYLTTEKCETGNGVSELEFYQKKNVFSM